MGLAAGVCARENPQDVRVDDLQLLFSSHGVLIYRLRLEQDNLGRLCSTKIHIRAKCLFSGEWTFWYFTRLPPGLRRNRDNVTPTDLEAASSLRCRLLLRNAPPLRTPHLEGEVIRRRSVTRGSFFQASYFRGEPLFYGVSVPLLVFSQWISIGDKELLH